MMKFKKVTTFPGKKLYEYQYTDNMKVLQEIVDSDLALVEITDYNGTADTKACSLRGTIKRMNIRYRSFSRKGRVFVMKLEED